VQGLYTAMSIMMAALSRQEAVARNLANASTTGYKAARVRVDDFEDMYLALQEGDTNALGLGVEAVEAVPDLSQGPLLETGRALDLAVSGEAFFVVETPDGARLTRDGSFGLNGNRELVTAAGYRVLGQDGPITLPEGEVAVNEAGSVFVDGNLVAQLNLAVIEEPQKVQRVGDNLISAPFAPAQPGEVRVLQGYLEGSNVDLADSATKLLEVTRVFEAAQRVVMMESQVTDAATDEVGKV